MIIVTFLLSVFWSLLLGIKARYVLPLDLALLLGSLPVMSWFLMMIMYCWEKIENDK